MNIVPTSYISRSWFDALKRLEHGTLRFTEPDGTVTTFRGSQPGPEADFRIKDWDVIRHCCMRGDIALGEDYIAGAWETESIERLISLFLLNMDKFDGYAHAWKGQRGRSAKDLRTNRN